MIKYSNTPKMEIRRLLQCIKHVPLSKRDFAQSLVAQAAKKGTLTDKQMEWVQTLGIVAQNRKAKEAGVLTEKGKPQVDTPANTPIDAVKLLGMFTTAVAKGKQYPKMFFEKTPIGVIKLALVKSGSRMGGLAISDGRPFGYNTFYGYLTSFGEIDLYTAGKKAQPWLGGFLKQLANTPESVLVESAHKSGKCCFCKALLETDKSKKLGYGPVCAVSWGLTE